MIGADGTETKLSDAGAVRFSQPTGKTGRAGELVYLPPEQEITAENSAGKVIVRDYPAAPIPLVGFQLIGEYITPDLASQTGNYDRPFLGERPQPRSCSLRAGGAAVVSSPSTCRANRSPAMAIRIQARSREPAVFVAGDMAAQLKALAAEGGNSARVSCAPRSTATGRVT